MKYTMRTPREIAEAILRNCPSPDREKGILEAEQMIRDYGQCLVRVMDEELNTFYDS